MSVKIHGYLLLILLIIAAHDYVLFRNDASTVTGPFSKNAVAYTNSSLYNDKAIHA